ncbi:peptidase C15 [Galliscardovia ingluviei]|uniref:Pyroglutamyl-peptidase I n=1 Tax=Galliscardovia ingluviei TaxID=1769422 RepID=A0A8J3EYJ7_9BIFI|nr:pyroglutamyl-peptidase I [Galliscardovia ingluviei]GGI13969.1 peptidase C15 [Galliscardovia ingluviei]
MRRMHVVVCGFEHYDGLDVNPCVEVVQALTTQEFAVPHEVSVEVVPVLLPTSFQHAWPKLREAVNSVHADIVLATGVKSRAHSVALERCATNLIDANRPDADNVQPRKVPIDANGPAAYWTRLPLRAIFHEYGTANIPAVLSSDAGTFVCNSLFYQLLHWNAEQDQCLSGFLSFPPVNAATEFSSGISIEQMISAGRIAVQQTLTYALRSHANEILE